MVRTVVSCATAARQAILLFENMCARRHAIPGRMHGGWALFRLALPQWALLRAFTILGFWYSSSRQEKSDPDLGTIGLPLSSAVCTEEFD